MPWPLHSRWRKGITRWAGAQGLPTDGAGPLGWPSDQGGPEATTKPPTRRTLCSLALREVRLPSRSLNTEDGPWVSLGKDWQTPTSPMNRQCG